MSERGNHTPEGPENWENYSRMLRELPERPMPPGADGRLQARLSSAIATPRPDRRWLAGAASVAAGALAIIAGIGVFSPEEAPPPSVSSKPAVITDQKPKRPRRPRVEPRRPAGPQFSEHPPVAVDTNIPHQIPVPNGQPQVTTGGDRRDVRGNATSAPVTQPRTRTTP